MFRVGSGRLIQGGSFAKILREVKTMKVERILSGKKERFKKSKHLHKSGDSFIRSLIAHENDVEEELDIEIEDANEKDIKNLAGLIEK